MTKSNAMTIAALNAKADEYGQVVGKNVNIWPSAFNDFMLTSQHEDVAETVVDAWIKKLRKVADDNIVDTVTQDIALSDTSAASRKSDMILAVNLGAMFRGSHKIDGQLTVANCLTARRNAAKKGLSCKSTFNAIKAAAREQVKGDKLLTAKDLHDAVIEKDGSTTALQEWQKLSKAALKLTAQLAAKGQKVIDDRKPSKDFALQLQKFVQDMEKQVGRFAPETAPTPKAKAPVKAKNGNGVHAAA